MKKIKCLSKIVILMIFTYSCNSQKRLMPKDSFNRLFTGTGKIFIGDELERYKKLSNRGQFIIDSLKESGIPLLQQSYLAYEPIYMKQGKKKEWFYEIIGENVVLYHYLFWNQSHENGIQLLQEKKLK